MSWLDGNPPWDDNLTKPQVTSTCKWPSLSPAWQFLVSCASMLIDVHQPPWHKVSGSPGFICPLGSTKPCPVSFFRIHHSLLFAVVKFKSSHPTTFLRKKRVWFLWMKHRTLNLKDLFIDHLRETVHFYGNTLHFIPLTTRVVLFLVWLMKLNELLRMVRNLKHKNQVCISRGSKPYSLIHPLQGGPPFEGQREMSRPFIAVEKQNMRSHTKEARSNLEGYRRLP